MWGLRTKPWAKWNKGPYYKRKLNTDSSIKLLLPTFCMRTGNAGEMVKYKVKSKMIDLRFQGNTSK